VLNIQMYFFEVDNVEFLGHTVDAPGAKLLEDILSRQ
jgi:hypothetical protein